MVQLSGRSHYLIRLIALGAIVVHTLAACSHGGPVAVPDVSAYLSVSQWFHGGHLPEPLNYHPGYGILLSPFGWLSGSQLHLAALVVNGFLAGGVVLLAAKFTLLIGLSPRFAVFVAGLAAVHPSVAVSSRIAWPETSIVVIILFTTLIVHSRSWLLAGFVSTLSVCVHPRLIVVSLAVILVAFGFRGLKKAIVGSVIAVFIVAIALVLTGTWPDARLEAAQSLRPGPGPMSTAAGQWLALVASTVGLGALSFSGGIRNDLRRKTNPHRHFLLISAIGMLLLGGWVLAGSERPDTLLYSRYIAPWSIPLAITGLAAVSQRSVSRRSLVLLSGASLLCIGLVAAETEHVSGPVRQIMTLDLAIVWFASDSNHGWTVAIAGVLTLGGFLGFTRFLSVSTLVLLFFCLASSVVAHAKLHDVGRISEGQSTAARYVPSDARCLAHDSSAKSYSLWLYRLELPSLQHRRVDLSAGQKPCGQYVVAAVDTFEGCSEAELIVKEPRASWGLWRYPTTSCN